NLPPTAGALSRGALRQGPRLLLRVRAAGVPLRLASRPLGRRTEPAGGMAHRLRGGVAVVERAERPRRDTAAPAGATLRADRRAALEDRRDRSPGAAVLRVA